MLDKSVPFHSIIMMRPFQEPPVPPAMPEGYSVRAYQSGYETAWANIEASVGEFENESAALQCFQNYLRNRDELCRRQWYAVNASGAPVATATGWFTSGPYGSIHTVHALGCLPEYQNMGLGRAVAVAMLRALHRLKPERDIWLDTQTWSYRAIGLYLSIGFIPMKKAVFSQTPNEFDAALPVLEKHMKPDAFSRFIASAL